MVDDTFFGAEDGEDQVMNKVVSTRSYRGYGAALVARVAARVGLREHQPGAGDGTAHAMAMLSMAWRFIQS